MVCFIIGILETYHFHLLEWILFWTAVLLIRALVRRGSSHCNFIIFLRRLSLDFFKHVESSLFKEGGFLIFARVY